MSGLNGNRHELRYGYTGDERMCAIHRGTCKYTKSLSTGGVFKFSFPTESSLALGNLQSLAQRATSNKISFHVVCASDSGRREPGWVWLIL